QRRVAIAIARQAGPRRGELPGAYPDGLVGEDHRRMPRPGALTLGALALRRCLRQIEGARPQRSFETRPARRRLRMVKKRGRSEETLLRHLTLKGALGHVRMSLLRVAPFGALDGNPFAFGHSTLPACRSRARLPELQ